MNIIKSTRLKLTFWYVSAIMIVSLMFSIAIFSGVSQNIENSFARAESKIYSSSDMGQQLLRRAVLDPKIAEATQEGENIKEILHELFMDELKAAKHKVLLYLFLTNGLIFLASVLVSYVLAGKSLEPIEESMSEQKRFIADASHELRTPLTSLKTSIEVSLRDKSISAQAKSILNTNLEDVDALNKLIDSLLQLASQEKKTVVKQLVDIREIITHSIKTIKPMAKEKNISISSRLVSQQILASDSGLNELFNILLDNAVKYSSSKTRISVSTTVRKKTLVIKISDTGIGISKKYLPYIFDRFYRVDTCRTTSQRPGFGLGLSVAQQIVQNHGGKILVDSQIGKGTTFSVLLPL